MGVKFTCEECGYVLHVKAELAGKRGFCPKCHAKVDIPAASAGTATARPAATGAHETPELDDLQDDVQSEVSGINSAPAPSAAIAASNLAAPIPVAPQPAAPSVSEYRPAAVPVSVPVPVQVAPVIDPIAENPQMQWYVVPPGATAPYGPATGNLFRSWIDEGRVTADSLVWRQDWKDWLPASSVLVQFRAPVPQSLPPLPSNLPNMPAAGMPSLTEIPSFVEAPVNAPSPDEGEAQEGLVLGEKPRRVVKKPRDFTNILIIVLAIGVAVLLPVMIYVLNK